MSPLLILSLAITLSALPTTCLARVCPLGEFYDYQNVTCTPCSSCPINQIIRRPCSRHRDTICGPFYEFEFFNHVEQEQRQRSAKSGPTSGDRDGGGSGGGGGGGVTQQPVKAIERTTAHIVHHEVADDLWRHLCYGLMAALSLVIVYGIVMLIMKRYRGKIIIVTDPSNPGVYYQAEIISSPSSTTSTCGKSRSHILEQQLQRMFYNPRSENVYVDPTGRVYSATGGDEQTHHFVRVHMTTTNRGQPIEAV